MDSLSQHWNIKLLLSSYFLVASINTILSTLLCSSDFVDQFSGCSLSFPLSNATMFFLLKNSILLMKLLLYHFLVSSKLKIMWTTCLMLAASLSGVTSGPCDSNPCSNGATCQQRMMMYPNGGIVEGYRCTCAQNYYGTKCLKGRRLKFVYQLLTIIQPTFIHI